MGRVFELFPRLKERSKQKAVTLSGGERQMLAIGAGIMTKPKLLLLDEPTAGLAPGLVLDVLNKICEIRDSGATIILVEQHAEKALEIADQAAVLLAGKKVLDGNADEILKREDIGQVFLGKVRQSS
jgi:branched-chain amino acid transport system ATP-binding protein